MHKFQKKRDSLQIKMLFFMLLIPMVMASCQEAPSIGKTVITKEPTKKSPYIQQPITGPAILAPPPISQFVRRIFQDSRGNFWFGTNGDGVLHYDGREFQEFTPENGFDGVAVRAILEDKEGRIWFGTERGVIRYDHTGFKNFSKNEGLVGEDVWSMHLDRKGTLWVGTIDGVSYYQGGQFATLPLPESDTDPLRGVTSKKIVHDIMEDREGRLWFAVNDGAYKYDPTRKEQLQLISEKDGLANKVINDMLEDSHGNIWFATHHKGVSRYDGQSFINFTKDGMIAGDEVWSLYEDSKGNIWFPAEHYGVYQYDGTTFTNYRAEDGLPSDAIQTIFEDSEGRMWFGGYNGLSRLDGKEIITISRMGPWD